MQPAQYSELRTITESAAAAIAADLESRDGQGKTQTNAIPGSVSRNCRAGKGVVLFTHGFRAAVAAIHGK